MGGEPRGGPSETNRVEFFSDGVFAIAVTLLVLELAIPGTRGAFRNDLLNEWPSYVAYLAAFGTIGVLWMAHHTTFLRIRRVDTGLLWRNLLLLLSTSLFPFPTAVIASAYRIGDTADQAAAVVLYAVVGILSGAAWLVFFAYLRGQPALLEADAGIDASWLQGPLLTIAGFGLAGLIGWFLSPATALAIFLFFPIFYVLRVRRVTRA
jgi:uncharacterized membrane protein